MMAEVPDGDITLETPHDWVRQGERRAERHWAASHPAKPIPQPKPPVGEPPRRWSPGAAAGVAAAVVLGALFLGAPLAHRGQFESARRPVTIPDPSPRPTVHLATTTATATLTKCTGVAVGGTVTNTGSVARTFVVSVYAQPTTGRSGTRAPASVPAAHVRGLAPGATATWSSPMRPAMPGSSPTCSLFSVTP